MKITIAARKSDLARLQAYTVGEALRAAHPGLTLSYAFSESLGDKNLTDPLWKMPERGVFTEDFVEDLRAGRCDMVVHSWKDLPLGDRPGTEVVATLPREDSRDLLLFRRDRFEAARAGGRPLRILTSSPRRAHNLGAALPGLLPFKKGTLNFEAVRGNVPTRVRKLFEGDCDGLIVAKAAMDRLLAPPPAAFAEEFSHVREELAAAVDRCLLMLLPLSLNPTAAAQGALAIEISRERKDLRDLLAAVHSRESFDEVVAERKILGQFGGGCHQKIGVSLLSKEYGRVLYLRGLTDEGRVLDEEGLYAKSFDVAAKLGETAALTKDLKIWPLQLSQARFFEREPIAAKKPEGPLWIARAEALPEDWTIAPTEILWTSGLEGWRRLAARGLWVSGSCEGRGEDESPRLDSLLRRKLSFTKLSHEAAPEWPGGPRLLPTYRLKARGEIPDLSGYSEIFWPSASAFEAALKAQPALREKSHACGPGNTARLLRKILGPGARLRLFLNHDHWLRSVLTRDSLEQRKSSES